MAHDCVMVAARLPFEAWLGGSLQPYAAIVRSGLVFFLERLPRSRRETLDVALAGLSVDAPPAIAVVTLFQCCPTLHKLGQMLARDRRLPPTVREALQQLEQLVACTGSDVLQATVEAEIGPLSALHITVDEPPLAEASVAVVLPFNGPDGRGVFKILKPDIEAHLTAELTVWQEVAEHIEADLAAHGLATLDAGTLFARVQTLLLREINPVQEQRHLDEAGQTYADQPGVHVPALLPWCSPRVTAMTRIEGVPVEQAADPAALARRIIRALIAAPILNTAPFAFFHGDPHAGNLIATPDEGLGVVDWSLCDRLAKSTREDIVQIFVAAWAADATGVARHVAALASNAVPHAVLSDVCSAALGNLAAPWIPGLHWLTGLLDAAALSAGCRFDSELLLFRKVVLILEGLVADLDPTCTLDRIMIEAGLQQHCQDSWLRPFTTPTSRAFGTHLSNLDLAHLAWSTPPTVLRAWRAMLGVAP